MIIRLSSLLITYTYPVYVLVAVVVLMLAGCAQNQLNASSSDGHVDALVQQTVVEDSGPREQIPVDAQDSDLVHLLVNEFAYFRNSRAINIDQCRQQASANNDKKLAQRCYEYALKNGNNNSIVQSAQLWLELDSDNEIAYRQLGHAYMLARKYPQALDTFIEAQNRGFKVDVTLVANNSVFLYGEDIYGLIEHYRFHRAQSPNKQDLLIGEIILQNRRSEQNYYIGKYNDALQGLNELLTLDGVIEQNISFQNSYLFKARSLQQLGRPDEAVVTLEQAIAHNPNYIVLQMELVDLHLQRSNYQKAGRVIEELLDNNGSDDVYFEVGRNIAKAPLSQAYSRIRSRFANRANDSASTIEQKELALLRLGILASEAGNTTEQRQYLQQIATVHRFVVAAVSMIAEVEAQEKGKEFGASYYQRAREVWPSLSDSLWQAQARWLSQTNRLDAIALLDSVIEENASDSLLYSRGLMHAFEGNIAQMELDFQRILKRNPNHVDTLNAYGYTLVDLTDRLDEGMRMINIAFALDSERPAIVDSLSWSHFRQGNFEQALVLIHWAYSRLQDPEIGAHYAEILWNLNYKEEAKMLLDQELRKSPDNEILNNTMHRLFEKTNESEDNGITN